jgi:4-diphosphocytidyl-2-C-methyl-D-erythritol kinase
VSQTTLTLPSFAKINWTLHVLGRRADNYHELHTIFQTITLQDTLHFALRDDDHLELACDAPDIPVDESNLIHRAASALREKYGVKKGASIMLEKRIPSGGGLGGGSSNAAVTLLALANLWEIETTQRELEEVGATLGADVPFFMTGGMALGIGLGTEIRPLDEVNAKHLLIVAPDVKVSTVEAYKALNAPSLTKVRGDIILSISRASAEFADSFPRALRNDFEPVIFRLEPEIERARNALLNAGAIAAQMSGSGSSVFGIFDNREAQQRALEILQTEPRWKLFSCASLARTQYQTALGICAAPLRT